MNVPDSVVEACQRGDPEAFEELVRLTHREVFTLAYRLVGDRQEAEDVSQETYIRLLRSIKQFRGEAKFSTWLYRVTSSVAISSMRKKAKQRLDVPLDDVEWQADLAPASADPVRRAEQHELRADLDDALAKLTPGYRAVVVLKDVYGLRLEEIGRQLGITEGAAKVRLFRARERLRHLLRDHRSDQRTDGREVQDGVQ